MPICCHIYTIHGRFAITLLVTDGTSALTDEY